MYHMEFFYMASHAIDTKMRIKSYLQNIPHNYMFLSQIVNCDFLIVALITESSVMM